MSDQIPETPPGPALGRRPTIWSRWGSLRIGLYAAGLLLLDVAGQVVVYVAVDDLFAAAAGGGLALLVMAAATARSNGNSLAEEFGVDIPPRRRLALMALVALAALTPTSWLATLSARIHPPPADWLVLYRAALPDGAGSWVMALASVAIVVPVAEELLFRGVCHRLCRRHWGPLPAAVVSALLFALVHGEPWYLFGLFGLGLVLSWIYETTASVTLCAAVHSLHNTISIVMLSAQDEAIAETVYEYPDPLLTGASLLVLAWALLRLRRRS